MNIKCLPMLWIWILICSIPLKKVNGQTATLHKNVTLSAQPLFVINGGFRIDLEKRLSNHQYIVFSPTFYRSNFNKDKTANYFAIRTPSISDSIYDRKKGLGLNISYKHVFNPEKNLYWQIGTQFQWFEVSFLGRGWEPFEENGNVFYRFINKNVSGKTNAYALQLAIGKREPLLQSKNWIIDYFAGIAYQQAQVPNNIKLFRNYANNLTNIGYSGLMPIVGLKIGYAFE